MTQLLDLPVELLRLIVDYLKHDDLTKFARTAWKAHGVAEPALYCHVLVDWEWELRNNKTKHTPLKTLLQRPYLADIVKIVDFDRELSGMSGNDSDSDSDLKDEFQKDVSRDATLNPTSRMDEFDMEIPGDATTSMGLLLGLTKNLETLRINSSTLKQFLGMEKFLDGFTRGISNTEEPTGFLRSLKKAYLSHNLPYEMLLFDQEKIAGDIVWWLLLHCPALELLEATIHHTVSANLFKTVPLQRITPSSLTSLGLRYTLRASPNLRQILTLTPKLKSLKYDISAEMNGDLVTSLFLESEWFSDALRGVAHSLKELRLGVEFYSEYGDGFWSVEDLPSFLFGKHAHSFSFLEHLEELTLPIVALLGWEPSDIDVSTIMSSILPTTLKSLTLTDDATLFDGYRWKDTVLLKRLEPYIHNITIDARALKTLILEIPSTDEWWFEDTEQYLSKLCSENGIVCDITRSNHIWW